MLEDSLCYSASRHPEVSRPTLLRVGQSDSGKPTRPSPRRGEFGDRTEEGNCVLSWRVGLERRSRLLGFPHESTSFDEQADFA